MSILLPENSRIRFPVGISNYRQLRQGNYLFVDKTAFISRVIESDNPALLVPRPRRFGKTLNQSLLKFFFEMKGKNEEDFKANPEENLSDLFADTAIWKMENGFYQEHFQQYPVVFLTFKNIKNAKWENAWILIRDRIQSELERLDKKYDLFNFSTLYRTKNLRILLEKNESVYFEEILGKLVFLLHKITGRKVILLIDEYDAPLFTANENGYWKEAIDFFAPFLSSGFKDQEFLFKGVITGILKIAKESIFSGMNNLSVYTILSHKFRSDFGFTENEVEELLQLTNQTKNHGMIKDWYNGYQFGDEEDFIVENSSNNKKDKVLTIYNPWSILKHLERGKKKPQIHWINTSANTLIRELLHGKFIEYGDKISSLLQGECLSTRINQNLELKAIKRSRNALWSLFLFSGHLTVKKVEYIDGRAYYDLCIPNKEIHQIYTDVFEELLFECYENIEIVLRYMLEGKVELFEEELNNLLLTITSYHDFAGRSEAAYHAFMIGLTIQLRKKYIIRSNRETGYGRADLVMVPKRKSGVGVIFEFKFFNSKKPSITKKEIEKKFKTKLQEGIKQVIKQKYIAEFNDREIQTIHQYVVVFYKKSCRIRMVSYK